NAFHAYAIFQMLRYATSSPTKKRWALKLRNIEPQPPTVGNFHSSATAARLGANATAQPNGTRTSATGATTKKNSRKPMLRLKMLLSQQTLCPLNHRLNQRLRLRQLLSPTVDFDRGRGRRPSGGYMAKWRVGGQSGGCGWHFFIWYSQILTRFPNAPHP